MHVTFFFEKLNCFDIGIYKKDLVKIILILRLLVRLTPDLY